MFEVCLLGYIEDVKRLVSEAMRAEIKALNEGGSLIAKMNAKRRQEALRLWLAESHPLSCDEGVLSNLFVAVNPQKEGTRRTVSLVEPTCGAKPLSFFTDMAFEQAKKKKRELPFVQNGMFQTFLATAIDEVERIMIEMDRARFVDPANNDGLQEGGTRTNMERLKPLLLGAAEKLQIHHTAWCANPIPGARGRRSTLIVHTMWLQFNRPETRHGMGVTTRMAVRLGLTDQEMDDLMVEESSELASEKSSRSAWSAVSYRISSYHKILHKTVLPMEWSIDNATIKKDHMLTLEAYEWVKDNYDASKPLHCLALFISLVFCGILPKSFMTIHKGSGDNIPLDKVEDIAASSPWVERSGKKGSKEMNLFITMVTAFVIAVADDRSPVSKALQRISSKRASKEVTNQVSHFMSKHCE